MKRIIALSAVTLVLAATPAHARSKHRAPRLSPECNVTMPCEAPSYATPRARRASRGQQLERAMPFGRAVVSPRSLLSGIADSPPVRFIRGRLVCARNVNAALAARGIRGTGSAAARSFLQWGSSSRHSPRQGDIAVFSRGRHGGHVAIVAGRNARGQLVYWNPSSRGQRWRLTTYREPLDIRTPG